MPTKSPRPPSPGGQSVASAASRASTILKPTISIQKKQRDIGGSPDSKSRLSASVLSSVPQGPSAIDFMTVESCMEYVSAPHHTWDSASREMARMATKAQLTQAALEARGGGKGAAICDDTASVRSGMSSISAFSFAKSNASTARRGVSRGHMAMLPLGGQPGNTITSPKEVPDLVLSGTSAGHAGQGTFSFLTQGPSSRSGRLGAGGGNQKGYEGGDEVEVRSESSMRRVGSMVGAAGGLSGIRNARTSNGGGPSSAPIPGKRPVDDTSSVASSRINTGGTGKKMPPAPTTRKQPAPPASHDLSDLIKVGSVKTK